jgi:hypothetical protein
MKCTTKRKRAKLIGKLKIKFFFIIHHLLNLKGGVFALTKILISSIDIDLWCIKINRNKKNNITFC